MRYIKTQGASGEQAPAAKPTNHQNERRSPRIVCAVPLTVSHSMSTFEAQSAVINAHGVLLVTPEPIPEGNSLTLINRRSGRRVEATVVFSGLTPLAPPSSPDEGSFSIPQYKVGVEFRQPMPEFWGSDYAT